MARRRTLLTSAFAALASPALAEDSLKGLFDRLGPAPAGPEGRVLVTAWIEPHREQDQFVVSLAAEGNVRLVADPGITVTPRPASGVAWRSATPVRLVDSSTDYFAAPPQLRLPVQAAAGSELSAHVTYAYCVVGSQCLFGETEVNARVPDAAG